MAFSAAGIYKVCGADPALYIYKTADAIATVTASGYFNNYSDTLHQYDVIIVIGETGGTPKIDLIFVTSATFATTVTTSATEGVTAT